MDDLRLVRRCLRREKRAWDEFIQRFSGLIYSYILSVFKSRASYQFKVNNIDDAFQEIFLLLTKDNYRKLKTYQGRNGCSLASWLRQVVINFSLDYTRNSKPLLSLDQAYKDKGRIKDFIIDQTVSAKDKLIEGERITQLKECISGLGNEEKRFLELHVNRGVSPDRLTKVFKVSRGALDMRKARIINHLRRSFRRKDGINR